MITTIKLPKAVVSNHPDCITDFILSGACEYENSNPVTENIISPNVMMMYWGNNHNIWMLFGSETVTVSTLPCRECSLIKYTDKDTKRTHFISFWVMVDQDRVDPAEFNGNLPDFGFVDVNVVGVWRHLV